MWDLHTFLPRNMLHSDIDNVRFQKYKEYNERFYKLQGKGPGKVAWKDIKD